VHVAIIGGLERHEPEIERRASQMGHTVEFHRGRVGGRRSEELVAVVSRSDAVIIVTQVNSHGAMHLAKRVAVRNARPALITRTCSPSSFPAIVGSLESRHPNVHFDRHPSELG
jgi:hypothetical protein